METVSKLSHTLRNLVRLINRAPQINYDTLSFQRVHKVTVFHT